MTDRQPTAWFDGELRPCTIPQFTQSLRRYAGYADREFGMRSDPAGAIGERLNAAADVIDDMWRRVGAILDHGEQSTRESNG